MTLTFDLLTLELVRNVSRSTDNLPVNYSVFAIFIVELWGKHAPE